MRIEGVCHCGNLSYRLETALPPEALPVRACDCSFCRAHGARCTSDPRGSVEIRAKQPTAVSWYRFELSTADFLVCSRCGVYVAAVIEHDDQRRATVNLAASELRDLPAASVSYAGESRRQRVERRLSGWTPVRELRL